MVCIKPSRAYDQRPGMVTWKVRVPIRGKLFISTSRNMAERVFLMDAVFLGAQPLFREVTYVKYLILHLNLLWMEYACANYRGRITSAIL